MLRTAILATAFLSCSAFAQTYNSTCQQIGNTTYCNGQAQQQNSGNANWLQYQQTPNMYDAVQKGREDALRNRMAQQQLEEAQAQARRNQELHDQQMALLQQQQQATQQAAQQAQATQSMPQGSFFNELSGYDNSGHDDPRVLPYLDGAGEALLFANVDLQSKGLPRLYCQPGTLTLNAENYREIVDKAIAALPDAMKRKGEAEHWPIEFILLDGLKKTFPCPVQQSAPVRRRK